MKGVCIALMLHVAATVASGGLPRVPEGYEIELVAGAEHLVHPMLGCFDDRGRLYVCESAGTNRRAAELIADPQDSIRVLEDTDGDGRFDKSWTFADKLVFPQGCVWYRGSLYTCSSPYVWKLTDTDGDGVCDEREVLVKSFGFSGNAADIHGPFLSPDGRLYWCDGRHGHEIRVDEEGRVGGADNVHEIRPDPEPGLPNPGGELLSKGKAARIFSCRPDGSDLRVFAGGGMDNPVEVDFLDTGEVIGTVNLFYGRPRGDTLVHWVEGGVYPREDQQDAIAEFPWTGGLLGPVTNYGHVAVSGLCVDRAGFASDEEGSGAIHVFVTEFNTHKVVLTTLERSGSTFRAVETRDFLVSDDPDFHPTDVLQDADGSLLVIDTGGWFRIGCPTSQVAKPQIVGAIYRIRKTSAAGVDDPLGLAIDWETVPTDLATLASLLGDHRPAVREKAIEAAARVIDSDDAATKLCHTVFERGSGRHLRGLFHAAGRVRRTPLLAGLLQKVENPADRVTALLALPWQHVATHEESRDLVPSVLCKSIASEEAGEARAALEVAARLFEGRPEDANEFNVVDAIRKRLEQPGGDSFLEHAAIVALTRIGDRDATFGLLSARNPSVQRAGLIALDQMPQGRLTREAVLPLLATGDARLQEAALEVISHREAWSREALSLFETWLQEELTEERSEIVRRFLAAGSSDVAVQSFIAVQLSEATSSVTRQLMLLEAMSLGDLEEWPAAWTPVVEELLDGDHPEVALAVLQIIGARGLNQFDAAVTELFRDQEQPDAVRIEALTIVAERLEEIRPRDREFITGFLRSDSDLLLRLKLASAYAAAPLSEELVDTITELTADLGPSFVPAFWPAYGKAQTPHGQQQVVKVLGGLEELPQVPESEVRSLIAGYAKEAQGAAAPLLSRIAARDAEAAERLERYLPLAEGGNAARGRHIFFGETAACSRCHRVGAEGAEIGPDLTTIARIRQPRDLVEAILLPSASFARGYQTYNVITEDGRQHAGILRRETADAIVLRAADLTETRIPRDSIELLVESETSIMPQGLEGKLSEAEFRDLLAYLQSLK